MPKHKETKIVDFTDIQMFDLVADIDNYHLFLPWCNNSRIIESSKIDSDNDYVIADLEIGYKNLVYIYRSAVSLNRKNLIIDVEFVDGPFKHLVNKWNFKQTEENKCEIDFFIDFELNVGVFNYLISKFFDKAFNKMVSSFEDRASQVYKS